MKETKFIEFLQTVMIIQFFSDDKTVNARQAPIAIT